MARGVELLDVVAALGLDIATKYGGASFGPCPSCGEAKRGKGDPRGRCVVLDKEDKRGRWACHANGSGDCGAKGDAMALVAWTLTGKAWTKGDTATMAAVRQWYADRGWCEPWTDNGQPATPAPQRTRPAPVARVVPEVPQRPPVDEVRDLWRRCVPVTADPAVAAYLAGRHDGAIDPAMVAALDLARALPADLRNLPRWAWRGQPWTASGHRLVVRAWEADPGNAGRLRVASLHARNILPGCGVAVEDDCVHTGPGACGTHKKAASPKGASAGGLLFATGPDPRAHGLPLVELAEGVPDWLRLALDRGERCPRGARPAVWGVTSGSADPAVAALVPNRWPVAIRTHADDSGDKYADRWRELLAPRGCTLRRQRKVNGPQAAAPVYPAEPECPPCPDPEPADPVAVACAALREAGDPAMLAMVWLFCCRDWGGPDAVPGEVDKVHRQRVKGLRQSDRDEYHAKLRELGAT